MEINKSMLFQVTEAHINKLLPSADLTRNLLFCNKQMDKLRNLFDKPNPSIKDLWMDLSSITIFLDTNYEETKYIINVHKYIHSKLIKTTSNDLNNNVVWAYNGSNSSSSSSSSSSMTSCSRTTSSWKSPNCGLTR